MKGRRNKKKVKSKEQKLVPIKIHASSTFEFVKPPKDQNVRSVDIAKKG